MKITLLAIAITIILLPSLVFAADYKGNLLLASQNDVNAAAAYTGVTGNLTISGADIVDLSPLAGFTQVGGYISMGGNPMLTKVIGAFPSLTDVKGGMFFYDNDSLLELSGFDALLKTGDNIDFWYNDVITSISGFASLHTAGWSLEFGDNPKLVEIPEFVSLQTIKSSLFILNNQQLKAITGFQALQFVSWSFQIQNNTSLNDLCGLYNYFTANNPYTGGGAFDIKNNGPGLPNPTSEQDVINAGPCPVIQYGIGCLGSGGVLPRLFAQGDAVAGQNLTVVIDHALGGATAVLFIGIGQAALSMGPHGCLLLVSPTPVLLGTPQIALAGIGSGGGSVTLVGAIPAGATGVKFNLQAFVSDTGGGTGSVFSNTNGLELTIQ